jgi:DnaJ-class molecular chaperone
MEYLLTKSIGLLFMIEHSEFRVEKYDTPFLHTNKGMFEVCYGEVVNKTIEITPMGMPRGKQNPDWYVIVFVERAKKDANAANTLLVKNDSSFKTSWTDPDAFAKTIAYKFWMDITKTNE